jgi:hypothetical protein
MYSVEYIGLTPGSEREIFQRVQLGMTLTAAGKFVWFFLLGLWTNFHDLDSEKLQAISSPWAE